jgi:hypothetical protein
MLLIHFFDNVAHSFSFARRRIKYDVLVLIVNGLVFSWDFDTIGGGLIDAELFVLNSDAGKTIKKIFENFLFVRRELMEVYLINIGRQYRCYENKSDANAAASADEVGVERLRIKSLEDIFDELNHMVLHMYAKRETFS